MADFMDDSGEKKAIPLIDVSKIGQMPPQQREPLSRGSAHVIRQTLEMCREVLDDEGYGAAVNQCETSLALLNSVYGKGSQ